MQEYTRVSQRNNRDRKDEVKKLVNGLLSDSYSLIPSQLEKGLDHGSQNIITKRVVKTVPTNMTKSKVFFCFSSLMKHTQEAKAVEFCENVDLFRFTQFFNMADEM